MQPRVFAHACASSFFRCSQKRKKRTTNYKKARTSPVEACSSSRIFYGNKRVLLLPPSLEGPAIGSGWLGGLLLLGTVEHQQQGFHSDPHAGVHERSRAFDVILKVVAEHADVIYRPFPLLFANVPLEKRYIFFCCSTSVTSTLELKELRTKTDEALKRTLNNTWGSSKLQRRGGQREQNSRRVADGLSGILKFLFWWL